jgi:hypothetical protein
MSLSVYKISIPKYKINQIPDWNLIGGKIDKLIKKHFIGQRLAIRCVGSGEHKGKTVDQLIKIIKKTGTDRYDPKRKGQRYKNIGSKRIDFFALDRTVTPKAKIMRQFIWSFWHYPKLWKTRPEKIDLVILYDRKNLKVVRYTENGKRYKSDGFAFKDRIHKNLALNGLVKII